MRRKHRYAILDDTCIRCGLGRSLIASRRVGCYRWVGKINAAALFAMMIDDLGTEISRYAQKLTADFLASLTKPKEAK